MQFLKNCDFWEHWLLNFIMAMTIKHLINWSTNSTFLNNLYLCWLQKQSS